MAPGRDAVRLIDRKERDACPLERFNKAAAAKAFRRDINELVFATAQRVDARVLFSRGY